MKQRAPVPAQKRIVLISLAVLNEDVFHRLHRFSPFCETSVMRRLLFALASVFQTDVFVECEVAVAAIFHPLDVRGADAVILETHQLFDRKIVVADIFQFANE